MSIDTITIIPTQSKPITVVVLSHKKESEHHTLDIYDARELLWLWEEVGDAYLQWSEEDQKIWKHQDKEDEEYSEEDLAILRAWLGDEKE